MECNARRKNMYAWQQCRLPCKDSNGWSISGMYSSETTARELCFTGHYDYRGRCRRSNFPASPSIVIVTCKAKFASCGLQVTMTIEGDAGGVIFRDDGNGTYY